MDSKETKLAAIYRWLRQGNTLTSLECWKNFGSSRLGAQVFKLKNEYGAEIITTMVDTQDQFGRTCRVAQYAMVKSSEIADQRFGVSQ